MRQEEKNGIERISVNDLFRKGIGLIVSLLLLSIMIIVFTSFNTNQIYSGLYSEEISYSILAKEIGSNLWSFRVYDLLIIVSILLLSIIGGYYLVNFKPVKKPDMAQIRRKFF